MVRLREHGLGGLGEDVGLRVAGHFLRHICVADCGLARLRVLVAGREVAGGIVEARLIRAHACIFVQRVLEGIVNGRQRSSLMEILPTLPSTPEPIPEPISDQLRR